MELMSPRQPTTSGIGSVMPSASSCYGHDAQGVNLQNLRSLNAMNAKELQGGFRPEGDWKRETHEAVVSANKEKEMSQTLREASRRLEEELKTKVEKEETAVDAALDQRIRKTSNLRNLVQKAIDNTSTEKMNLGISLKKLQDRASRIRGKMKMADDRTRHRCERPRREMVNDTVQLQLKKEGLMLRSYLTEVEGRAKAANKNIQRLDRVEETLRKDLKAKEKALEIDRVVLHGEGCGESVGNGFEYKAPVQQSHWNKKTENAIKEANSLARETAWFRHESRALLKENEIKRKNLSSKLNEAMLEKLGETEGLKEQLERQLDAVVKELKEAKHRKKALETALMEKRHPMERAAQRLSLRTRRPVQECVDDEAHRALVGEVQHIAAARQSLKSKIAAVNQRIVNLMTQQAALEANILDKGLSWKVDEECVMLDNRVALAHPPSSVRSSAASVTSNLTRISSSSRAPSCASRSSDILERISKLETEVATARVERIALEEKMADLTTG